MTEVIGWILAAFAIYLLMMIAIGAMYSKKNSSTADYFLGGRKLGGFVAALSAQASDMSGWLLMGLPGAIMVTGLCGDGWVALGLLIGTILNWLIVASRLRKYTIKANNSLTLPMFFENRFRDKKKILMGISSIIIVIFFAVYCASALAAGGQLFESIFGIDYIWALTIGAFVILVYTFLGGFMAVCVTDFIQGSLMLIALLAVPILAVSFMNADGVSLMAGLEANGITQESTPGFLNMLAGNNAVSIISGLAWGLGYFGMPHILVRFMAVKDEKEMTKSKTVAITWVTLSLVFACVIGVVGRAFMNYDSMMEIGKEKVFIEMIKKVFIDEMNAPFVAGIFLCGVLAAIMSTADSQLLVSASSMSEDLYKGIFRKDADEKTVMAVSRVTIVVIAVIAYVIAWDPDSSIMDLVSNAWAGLGAAFGPLVLTSLFWKRTNLQGAIAGLVSGALTVILWDYIPMISAEAGLVTLGSATGLYSLAVGFPVSLLFIIIVSLATKAPSEDMIAEFEAVKDVE
ncbi:MAG: sodium/proline symporter PutP [Lachnospiraceae bacterium]|nr:sodium/proline symporter PutP [Lachnospiraceae bacterium]